MTVPVTLSRARAGSAASLSAQLVDTAGASVGGAVTTGFVDLGDGHYEWTYAAFPDGHRGAVKFSLSGAHVYTAFVNPQTAENMDVKTSSISVPASITVSVSQVALAVAAAAANAGTVAIRRGDTISFGLTGLGTLTGRTKLWMTVKAKESDADSAALIQWEESTGLVYLNGNAATAGQGALTVTSVPLGNITVTLAAVACAQLPLGLTYTYDIQVLAAGVVRTLAEGNFRVIKDQTRATS